MHTYIKINVSYEGVCVEFEGKKEYNIGFPTYRLTQILKKNNDWPVKYYLMPFSISVTSWSVLRVHELH